MGTGFGNRRLATSLKILGAVRLVGATPATAVVAPMGCVSTTRNRKGGEGRLGSSGVGRRLNLDLEAITGTIVLVLIVLSPLARGLYFPVDLLQFQLAIALVFALEWLDRIARGDRGIIVGWPDAFPLLLGIAYCASMCVAVDKRAAIGEALKYLALFMVYWIVSRLSRTSIWATRFANAIVFAGVALSAVGLGAAVGLVRLPGAYVRGEILSTLQYPNALAGFLSAACTIIVALWSPRADRLAGGRCGHGLRKKAPHASWVVEAWRSLAFVSCSTVLFTTRSRGAWVLLPFTVAVTLWGVPGRSRFHVGMKASAAVVATLAILGRIELIIGAAAKVAAAHSSGQPGNGLDIGAARDAAARIGLWIGIAALAVLAVSFGANLLNQALERKRIPQQARIVAGYAVFLWAVGSALWYAVYAGSAYPTVARGFLPLRTAAAAESIEAGVPSLVDRQAYWADALRMIRDRPLLGVGGGGWNALYHKYQRRLYSSALVHSHPLQVAVESGTVGLAAYLGMWAVLVWNARALWRRRLLAEIDGEPDSNLEGAWSAFWPAFSGAIALGLHSSIDFDFSLTAIAACCWGLMACANGVFASVSGERARAGTRGGGPGLTARSSLGHGLVGLVFCALVFVPTMSLLEASYRGTSAANAMLSGDYAGAEKLYREAIRLDPYTSSYWVDLAQISLASHVIDAQPWRLDQVRTFCQKAVTVQPSSLPARVRVVEILATMGDLPEALASAEETAKWIPRDVRVYEGLARVLSSLAARAADDGDATAGRDFAVRACEVIPVAAKALNPDPGPKLPEALLEYAETPSMGYAVGQAAFMLGDYAEAVRLFEKALYPDAVQSDVRVWLGASFEAAGDSVQAQEILGQAKSSLGPDLFASRRRQVDKLRGVFRQ